MNPYTMNNYISPIALLRAGCCYSSKRIFAIAGHGPWTLAEILRMQNIPAIDRVWVAREVLPDDVFVAWANLGNRVRWCAMAAQANWKTMVGEEVYQFQIDRLLEMVPREAMSRA